MVAMQTSTASRHADLNQYTIVPRLDWGSLDFEHAYDPNGNLQVIAEYPRPADITGDYLLDPGDLSVFTTAFNDETSDGDFNGDGIYDQDDLIGFVTAFTDGPSTYYNARFSYDERNQLVEFEANDGPTPIKKSEYHYDCFNRRVASLVDSDGNGTDDEVTYFIYAGQAAWQLCEEFPSAVPTPVAGSGPDTTVEKSYVYGNYIDEVLQMRDHASDEEFFYHQDDLFSVYALTDEAGTVVERYEFGGYGQVSATDAAGTARTESAYGNTHTFTGRLLCDELTLDDGGQVLQYRHRYLGAGNGRFLQRDPAGVIDGLNRYQYSQSSPLTRADPAGLCSQGGGCGGGSPPDVPDYWRPYFPSNPTSTGQCSYPGGNKPCPGNLHIQKAACTAWAECVLRARGGNNGSKCDNAAVQKMATACSRGKSKKEAIRIGMQTRGGCNTPGLGLSRCVINCTLNAVRNNCSLPCSGFTSTTGGAMNLISIVAGCFAAPNPFNCLVGTIGVTACATCINGSYAGCVIGCL